MSFMDSLASNPGGGGIYGQPQPNQDPLALVNNIKDREMRDYQNKATFMADLSLKQDRLRALFNPETASGIPGSDAATANGPAGQNSSQGMPSQRNTVMAQDPNQITGAQRAELSMRQQGVDLDKAKLAQQGKMGQEALDIKTQQEQLNQQKSDSIHEQKVNELKQKADDSAQKLQLAQQEIDRKTKAGEDSAQSHKDAMEAAKAYHEVTMAQKDLEFQKTLAQHEEAIKNQKESKKSGENRTVQTSVNPEGTERTVRTKSGSAAQNVIKTNSDGTLHVTGPGGKEYDIPANKLDHWNSTVMGNGDQEEQKDLSQQPGSGSAFRVNP